MERKLPGEELKTHLHSRYFSPRVLSPICPVDFVCNRKSQVVNACFFPLDFMSGTKRKRLAIQFHFEFVSGTPDILTLSAFQLFQLFAAHPHFVYAACVQLGAAKLSISNINLIEDQ